MNFYMRLINFYTDKRYNAMMDFEKRNTTRYIEIGKITCHELCALSGILDNISATGLKIHYAFPLVVDLENEYEVQILPSNSTTSIPLTLKCQPQWVKEQDGNTYIGFKILYSQDVNRLNDFISHLEELSEDKLPEIK